MARQNTRSVRGISRLPKHLDLAVLRPPTYDSKGKNKGFETPEEADAEDQKRIRSERRGRSAKSGALAEKLQACSRWHPCGSSACRKCVRDLRLTVSALALRAFENEEHVRMVTLIFGKPYRGEWLVRKMRWPSPEAMVQKVRMDLKRHARAVKLAMGGIEVDLDKATGMAVAHAHLLVAVKHKRDLARLKASYKRNSEVNRPVKISGAIKWKDRPKAFSYCWKFMPMEKRRIHPDAKAKKVRLRGYPGRRALRWLDAHDPFDFIFTMGLGLRGTYSSAAVARYLTSSATPSPMDRNTQN